MPPPIVNPYGHIKIYNQPDCILPKSFFEGRFIPHVHQDSLDYEQWWMEQIRRCEQGWADGGYRVTGTMYYHLNFKKINMIDVATENTIMEHPYFAFEDQELFNDIEQCRADKLGIILITGRGWGKSFDVATVIEHEYTFRDVSECIVSASTDRFATLLWEKIEMGLNSQPEEIRRDMIENTSNQKQSGYEDIDPLTNRYKLYDDTSFIRKVVYDSDAEKTRGTRPNIHVFEEVGAWTGAAGLLDCLRKSEPSWWRGRFKTVFPMFIGTGGAMDTGGSIDAKLIFESPGDYGLRAYEYQDRKIGKFYPAYVKFGGFYEKSGVSDQPGAKEFLDFRRDSKKKNPDSFRQETSEFPYTPEEAFQSTGTGVFPIDILEKQYVRIERDPALKAMVQRGNLEWVRTGSKITGVKWEQDDLGVFEIVEHPEWTKKSWDKDKINNLYIAGCDSFDSVAEDTAKFKKKSSEVKRLRKSRGANFIYKRFYHVSMTSRIFVARIVQRTDNATDFYWNTVKLNMYYNAKVLVEYTKIGILQHYISEGFENMLYKRPRLDSTVVKETVSTNKYGISMPGPVKRHVISLLEKYVKTDCDQIYFPSFLRDMMQFTYERQETNEHDETMGASICMLADDDMYKVSAKEANSSTTHFPRFTRDPFGNLVFT